MNVFLQFGIDESVIIEIWMRFSLDIQERLKLLSQRVFTHYQKFIFKRIR